MSGLKVKIASAIREKDFLAKGVCLLLAVILWAFIVTGKTEKLRFNIPIMVKNLPSDMAISNMSERSASIILEGRKEDLKSINVKNIKAMINMANAEVGEPRTYQIQIDKQLPEDISISPLNSDVSVTVEQKENKWITVVPSIVGTVPKGKIIIDKTVVPERVRISGPKSAVDDVDFVNTEDVSVDNETSDIQRQTGLKTDKYKDITFGENTVTVKVMITDLKDLAVVNAPIKVRNGNKDYDYEIKDHDVAVYMRLRNNVAVATDDVEAYIDLGKINVKKLFGNDQKISAVQEMPIVVRGITISMADIISILPKKTQVKIIKKTDIAKPSREYVPD
jgi:hypothetical protein